MGLSRQNAMQTTFEGENGKTNVAEYFQGEISLISMKIILFAI